MKSLFIFTTVFLVTSQAVAWSKVLDCQQGHAVLDRFSPTQASNFYQLVIRDPETIEYFRVNNAVLSYRIDRGEMIIPLGIYDGAGEFTGDSDARQRDGRLYRVHFQDSNLIVVAYKTTSRNTSGYDLEAMLAQWNFVDCKQLVSEMELSH